METWKVTIAYGDGIGPEIMEATLKILDAADANLTFDEIKIGKDVYLKGIKSGIPPEAWEKLRANDVFLKAPITTPQGGGYKSLNVTIRKAMGLFANVRPVRAYNPYVKSNFPDLDLVIVRENEEDLYTGIEHQQTPEVVQCLKLVSKPGSESVIRYAFEYAKAYGRTKVTCMTKDNIMKMTDGMFHKIFNSVAEEYSDIRSDHFIIDIGSALIAHSPEKFDVIVTLNLYGDIISDIAAQVAGSVGMSGSANVGRELSMFEAIHGSAPDIAGKGIANPSGLLNGAIMMLVHLKKAGAASRIKNAWLKTLEDGIHTGDIYRDNVSEKRVGTKEFTQAVIDRLGEEPRELRSDSFHEMGDIQLFTPHHVSGVKVLRGVDIFLQWSDYQRDPESLGKQLEHVAGQLGLKLDMVTNMGIRVYPAGFPETSKTDHWRCRFFDKDDGSVKKSQITALMNALTEADLDFIKIENLYEIDGERGYSV